MPETIDVEIRARVDQLERELGRTSARMGELEQAGRRASTSISQQFQSAGTRLATFGAAAVLAGRRAVELGNAFETNMARITGLVGIARDEVDAMGASVMRLSGETATAPQELSNALFTITSAGLRGQTAMEALDVSARGAAAGMGDTRSVAQAMTGVLNAYAGSGITAAQAGDFLAGTARAGNFEVSELAGSIGRVLPIASSAGVALSDVGGSIALLTRNGLSASEAVTQTNAVLRGMIAPSGEAIAVLEAAGLTFDDVRATLQEDGLVAAIQQLSDAAGGSQEDFVKLVGGSEGASAAFTVLNADAATIEGTFGLVADSAGILDEAFEAVAETNAFRMRQALTDITTALTRVGLVIAESVVPVLQLLADGVDLVAGVFEALPGPLQSVVIALGGIAGPAGVALLAMSRLSDQTLRQLVSRAADAGRALVSFGSAMGVTSTAAMGVGAALTIAAAVYLTHRQRAAEARERADSLTAALATQAGTVPNLVERMAALADEIQRVANESGDAESPIADLGAATTEFLDRLSSMGSDGGADAFDEIRLSMEELVPIMQTGTDEFEDLQTSATALTDTGLGLSAQYDRLRDSVEQANGPNRDFLLGLLDQAEAADVSMGALSDLLDVIDEQTDAYDDLTVEQRRQAEQYTEQIAGTLGLSDARRDEIREAIRAADTYSELASALAPLEEAMAEYEASTTDAAGATGESTEAQVAQAEAAAQSEEAIRQAAEAGAEYAESARDMVESGDLFADRMGRVADVLSTVEDLLDSLSGAQQSVDDATIGTIEAFEGLRESIAAGTEAYAGYSDGITETALLSSTAGRDMLTAARDTASAIRDETLARLANGEAVESVTRQYDANIATLRTELAELGLKPAAIDRIIATYAEVPDYVVTDMAANVEAAQRDAAALIELMAEYGTSDPEALLSVDSAEARRLIGDALLAAAEFDREEATAALDASSTAFDMGLAAALLDLAGFDAERVEATLSGDRAALQRELDAAARSLGIYDADTATATLDADSRPAEAELTGVDRRLGELDSTTATATVRAVTDSASLSQASSQIDRVATPGPSARPARIVPIADSQRTVGVGNELNALATNGGRGRSAPINASAPNLSAISQSLDYAARTRYATIVVQTRTGYADGGIRERYANGGIRRDHGPARIVPAGANVTLFGEPETGGEAFIPLGPGKRRTAVPVLRQTAARLGYGLRKMADGGTLYGSGGIVSAANDSLQLTGTIVAHVDAGGLAAAVAAGAEEGVAAGWNGTSGNALLPFEQRLDILMSGGTTFDPNGNLTAVGLGGGGGLGFDPYAGLGEEQTRIERTTSGLANGLQQQISALGIMPEAINEIGAAVAELPRRQQMELVVLAQEAMDDSASLGELLVRLDALTVEPLMSVDVEQPRHDIGAALLDLNEFDAREAMAALAVNRDTFDPEFATAVLSLNGFNEAEATALIRGDAGPLRQALDEAIVALGLFQDSAAGVEAAASRPSTGSGVLDGLVGSLEELGFTERAISQILADVERMPSRRQVALAIDAERALSDSTVLVGLLETFDGMTGAALLEVEGNEEVRRAVGQGLLEVNDFAGREAVAALRAGSEGFDREFARTVLELSGFNDQEATALLNGNRAELQRELDDAVIELGLWGRQREDATVGAETDSASLNRARRELDAVADPMVNIGNPGGVRGRNSAINANLRGGQAVENDLGFLTRPRYTTITVRQINAFADGGIVEGRSSFSVRPSGTGVPFTGAAGSGSGSTTITNVEMNVVPERLVPSLNATLRRAAASSNNPPARETMLA